MTLYDVDYQLYVRLVFGRHQPRLNRIGAISFYLLFLRPFQLK